MIWGLIILNFYLVVTHNPDAVAFMTWSAAVAGIGVGGNILSKVTQNMKEDPTLTVTQTETSTAQITDPS